MAQVVKLYDVFPHGTGFVLVFEYMLSDLSEVLRNSARPLTEVRKACFISLVSKVSKNQNTDVQLSQKFCVKGKYGVDTV